MLKKAKWLVDSRPALLADALALASGLVFNLAFAPFDYWWLAPLCLAGLYVSWQDGSSRRQAWRGFLFGLGLFAVGISWVYLTLVRFGGAPPFLGFFGTACFVLILTLYPAVVGMAFSVLRRRDALDPWLFAALWTIGEWTRGIFLTGFPWFDAGYAAAPSPLLPWLPLIGALGVTFILALAASMGAEIAKRPRTLFIFVVVIAVATSQIPKVQMVRKVGAPVTISLIQGDISPTVKWDAQSRKRIIHHYLTLTHHAFGRVVVWPETSVPGYTHQLRHNFLRKMQRLAAAEKRHFLFGVVEGNEWDDKTPVYNAVISIGRHDGYYRKRHLVPFGEYLPWPSFFGPIMRLLHIPMSGFTPWPRPEKALAVPGAKIGLTICYEIAYGALVTQELPAASVLVNVSDDSWYGHSNEARQQFQIARVRAAEAGRDLAIATNDGITAVINHKGGVAARLAPFKPGVLTAVVQPYRGLTLYDRFGHWPIIFVVSMIVVIGFIRRFPTMSH